jgi:hypothetical protein
MEVRVETAIANAMTNACESINKLACPFLTNTIDMVENTDFELFAVQRDKNETKGCAPKKPPGPFPVPSSSKRQKLTHLPAPTTLEDGRRTSLFTFFKNLFPMEIMVRHSILLMTVKLTIHNTRMKLKRQA